jgi:ribokinase
MKVLVYGSLNIDYICRLDHVVRKGETIRSDSIRLYGGGKGLNQSIALSRAGLCPFLAGNIGKDGLFLLDTLKENHVDTGYINVLGNERTGSAFIQNDKDGDNCIILYGGANQSVTKEQVNRVLAGFGKGDYLILQNEISLLDYILERAAEKGMVIFLNPSPMNESIRKLDLQKTDWIILNELEAEQITGTETEDAEELIRALRLKVPHVKIVLTLGSRGSCYADETAVIWQDIYRTEAVDTVGAGDTFEGFFIASVAGGSSVKEALSLAAKASAIAVSRPGAAPSIPSMDEITDFFRA